MRTLIRRCLSLGPRAGLVYLIEAVKRALGVRDAGIANPLAGCRDIVVVCHGNILRSPFAAALLARAVASSTRGRAAISSAGLRARAGRAADKRGLDAAREYDIDLGAHRARLLTRDIVHGADAVVVMDFANHADFIARFGESRAKLRLLGAFDPRPRENPEIADPYMMDADGVRRAYVDIVRCVEGLCRSMALFDVEPAVRSPYARPLPGADRPAGADAARPSAQ